MANQLQVRSRLVVIFDETGQFFALDPGYLLCGLEGSELGDDIVKTTRRLTEELRHEYGCWDGLSSFQELSFPGSDDPVTIRMGLGEQLVRCRFVACRAGRLLESSEVPLLHVEGDGTPLLQLLQRAVAAWQSQSNDIKAA